MEILVFKNSFKYNNRTKTNHNWLNYLHKLNYTSHSAEKLSTSGVTQENLRLTEAAVHWCFWFAYFDIVAILGTQGHWLVKYWNLICFTIKDARARPAITFWEYFFTISYSRHRRLITKCFICLDFVFSLSIYIYTKSTGVNEFPANTSKPSQRWNDVDSQLSSILFSIDIWLKM